LEGLEELLPVACDLSASVFCLLPKGVVGFVDVNLWGVGVAVRVVRRDIDGAGLVEVDDGDFAEASKGLAYGGGEDLPYWEFVLELDFCLCGMNVDVDGLWLDGELEEVVGLFVVGDELVVTGEHGFMEIGMAHIASVDEEVLEVVAFACVFGFGDEAGDFDDGSGDVEGHELLLDAVAEKCCDALQEGGGGEFVQYAAVMGEGEGDVVVDQSEAFKLFDDIAELYGVAFKESPSCGYVEKEVFYHEVGADGACDAFLLFAA